VNLDVLDSCLVEDSDPDVAPGHHGHLSQRWRRPPPRRPIPSPPPGAEDEEDFKTPALPDAAQLAVVAADAPAQLSLEEVADAPRPPSLSGQ
jgi:hypothetical protein